MTNHNKQKLQEQLLAEFDALDKLGRGIGRTVGAGAKAIGSVAGGVAGLGSAIKKGYQAGKQTVGGGGANVNTKQQPKQQPKQQVNQQPKQQVNQQPKQQVNQQPKQPGKFSQAMSNIGRDLKGVAYDGIAGDGYDYQQGVRSQSDPIKTPKATSTPAAGKQTQTQTGTDPISQAMAKGGTQDAQKRQKTGGKVAGQTSNTKSAQYQRDRRAAKKAGGSAVSQGISQAQKDAANQGIANMKKQAAQTATKVPGQKQPSATAKKVGKKAGVDTAKIGGQKIDLNDPKMKNLRAAIEKAAPGVIGGVDKLQSADKEKLKKALA